MISWNCTWRSPTYNLVKRLSVVKAGVGTEVAPMVWIVLDRNARVSITKITIDDQYCLQCNQRRQNRDLSHVCVANRRIVTHIPRNCETSIIFIKSTCKSFKVPTKLVKKVPLIDVMALRDSTLSWNIGESNLNSKDWTLSWLVSLQGCKLSLRCESVVW